MEPRKKYQQKQTSPSWFECVKESSKTRVFAVVCLSVLIGLVVPALLDKYVWNHNRGLRLECQLPPTYRLNAVSRFGAKRMSPEELYDICTNESSCFNTKIIDSPPCYHPHPSNYYYEVHQIKECDEHQKTDFQVIAKMKEPSGALRTDQVNFLRMVVQRAEDHRVVVRIFNVKELDDFEPSNCLSYNSRNESGNFTHCHREGRTYDIDEKVGKLYVDVKRRGGPSIFNTNFGALIAEQMYMEITTVLPSHNVYGLGQGRHTTLRHNLVNSSTWTFFAGQDTGWGHGVHPFYLCLEDDGKAHGVLLEHSNAMEVTLQDVPSITYKTTGSKLRFHILMGPTPLDVIDQLTRLVGRPEMPPYWALGHHVCRGDESKAIETAQKLKIEKVPHESDCFADTLSLKDATYDWKKVSDFKKRLDPRQKLIMVQVPQVLKDDAAGGQYVKNSDGKENAIGRVNVLGKMKEVFYPNYIKPLHTWVVHRLNKTFHEANLKDGFDGYLLTNNTPVNEPIGACSNKSAVNFPKFMQGKVDLWNKTLCMDAYHQGTACGNRDNSNHFNLHNIYGYKHTQTVARALKSMKEYKNRRPFIASMSTFTGSGKFGGQISVGFSSSWEDMKVSLIQTLEFNMYGIPMVGAPVCGYHFQRDRDLCSRWTQMAAFQPLLISYHHPTKNDDDNDVLTPVVMDGFVTSTAVVSFELRYSLLPYLYTLFYKASIYGAPVVRPLFFEFPADPETRSIDEQFMWGEALLVSPVFLNSTALFSAYFPAGVWYNFYTGDTVANSEKGVHKNLTATDHQIHLHMRGGHIVPAQTQGIFADDVHKSSYKLRVAFAREIKDEPSTASGVLYIDDGISRQDDRPQLLVKMEATDKLLTLDPEATGKMNRSYYVDSIFIFGMRKSVPNYKCEINGKEEKCEHSDEHSTLSFRKLGTQINLSESYNITWEEKDNNQKTV